MSTFDVAIVGAGIVGAACAEALAREGLKVVIVDKHDIATGTTATGMGHIVAMDDSDAQFALTNYSRTLWQQLADELPPECEYERCGTIWVAADDDEMNEVRRKHDYYAEHDIRSEILDLRSLREAEPRLAGTLAGGLLVESDSVVYQLPANRFLIERAIAKGSVLRRGMQVMSIAEGRVELINGEKIEADIIVNAAGAAAPRLSPELNIVKRKGHLVITDRYPNFIRHQIIELGYLRSAHGRGADSVAFNVQPRKTGQVLLGSSRQFGAESADIDHAILRRMTTRAFEYIPKLRSLNAVRAWTGFRPATPDNLPFIGKIAGTENVYAAAGHEGLGITTSLGTAELLAAVIVGREPKIPLEPYSPSRQISEH